MASHNEIAANCWAMDNLFSGISSNDIAAVQRALRNGANVNATHRWSHATPLLQACSSGYDEIVRVLLDAGAN